MAARLHDLLVFIGRFQPLHNGHVHVINRALERARRVIVLVGSANVARSPRNPFSFAERRDTILDAAARGEIAGGGAGKLVVEPLGDFIYNDAEWISRARRAVEAVTRGARDPRIGLVGVEPEGARSCSGFFPDWALEAFESLSPSLRGTELRASYFRDAPGLPDSSQCPRATIDFLDRFAATESFAWLRAEAKYYEDYRALWGRTPWPVITSCVDTVCVQSGHVLLVERGHHPGMGLLALPGGHVEVDETFLDAAIRELGEETHLADARGEIPAATLATFVDPSKTRLFDAPHRSERGRVVTQSYLLNFPDGAGLFDVRAGDDAAGAGWHDLRGLRADRFFEDHAAIIREMTGAAIE